MSGSSLDGLDLAVCRFVLSEDDDGGPCVAEWSVRAAATDAYPRPWRARLRSAPHLPAAELWRLHTDLGHWFGQRARAFLDQHPDLPVDLCGSHGHTVFHDPGRGFTVQIGDGAALAHRLGLPTVTELRGADVAAGGQGAPLAPLADNYLLGDYDGHLNLGGIANLSWRTGGGDYLAGDVSGCCQILDRLAQRAGSDYDRGGRLAASGRPAPAVAQKIAALPYHQLDYPKSLDNGWVRDELWPLLDDRAVPATDLLHTFTRWLAKKIAYDLGAVAGAEQGAERSAGGYRILIAGGGAHNDYLVEQLRATQDPERPHFRFEVADDTTVDFKEAALIALAALFRVRGIANALPAATGAARATVNGALFLPGPTVGPATKAAPLG